jgi:hypothetical protein
MVEQFFLGRIALMPEKEVELGSAATAASSVYPLRMPAANTAVRRTQNKLKDTKDSKNIGKDRQAPVTASSGRTKSLLSCESFLTLLTTCFKGQDDQREPLLSSVHGQMLNYILFPKEERL